MRGRRCARVGVASLRVARPRTCRVKQNICFRRTHVLLPVVLYFASDHSTPPSSSTRSSPHSHRQRPRVLDPPTRLSRQLLLPRFIPGDLVKPQGNTRTTRQGNLRTICEGRTEKNRIHPGIIRMQASDPCRRSSNGQTQATRFALARWPHRTPSPWAHARTEAFKLGMTGSGCVEGVVGDNMGSREMYAGSSNAFCSTFRQRNLVRCSILHPPATFYPFRNQNVSDY